MLNSKSYTLDLSSAKASFSVQWFNPLTESELQIGSVKSINGGGIRSLGNPPTNKNNILDQDWVVMVKRL